MSRPYSFHRMQVRQVFYRDGRRRNEARCQYCLRSWPCPEAILILGPTIAEVEERRARAVWDHPMRRPSAAPEQG